MLRPLKPSDFKQWSEVRLRCGDWLTKWEPAPPANAADPSVDKHAFVARCRARDRERQMGTGFSFGVWHKRNLCGEVNISNVLRGAFNSASIGYWTDRQVAGQGFAGEAVLAALGYGFDVVGLERIQISIIPRNTASRRVAEKLGLRTEGVSLEYLQIAGCREDHIHYAITAQEWQQRCAENKAGAGSPANQVI